MSDEPATAVEDEREQIGPAFDPPPASAGRPPATPGSLRDRMRRRADEIAQRTTELFPVPLWDAILAVELRVIPWEESEKSITRNQRVPRLAMLNTAGDEIVRATVAFHEIKEDGTTEPVEDAHSWKELATTLGGQQLPDFAGERVALVSMCGDQGVIALNGLYRRWLGGAEVGLRSELNQDF